MTFSMFFSCAFLGVVESVAFAISFQDVDAMRKSVQECAGEALVSKDLRSLLERQVAGKDEATPRR